MTTNFALSLSFEGIELLHRVQGGWHRIGRVNIGSSSLDADLAELRQKAAALAPEGFTTKLIIPSDQIRFTAIDSTRTTQEDVDASLVDATPYALDELVIDCERCGGRTHIAAVARETLNEAEVFAMAHGFRPVAFVAIPEPFTFQKEVFFGPTDAMRDILGANATVACDDAPVSIIGTQPTSPPRVMDDTPKTPHPDPTDEPATPDTPSNPVASTPHPRIDAIPAEYRGTGVASTTAITPQRTFISAKLPLYDRVVPEVLLRAATPAAVPPVVRPARRKPLALAAGIAVAALVGAFAWSHLATSASDTNVTIAEPLEQAVPQAAELGPRIADITIAAFGAPNSQDTALPAIVSRQGPAISTAAPNAITASTPDARPATPQRPPAPPKMVEPVTTAVARGVMPSPAQADRAYAATGVWQRSPRFLDVPSGVIASEFNRPSVNAQPFRIAKPDLSRRTTLPEVNFAAPANPPPAGAVFVRDEDGFIQATPEGTLTPDGAIIFAGLPDLNINLRPELTQEELARMAFLAPAPQGVTVIAGRPDVVAPLRPSSIQLPQTEQTAATGTPPSLGGVGLAAFETPNGGAITPDPAAVADRAAFDVRPQLRPRGLASPATDPNTPDITDILAGIAADDATLRFDVSTALAVSASLRPAVRPSSFSTLVAAARAREQSSAPAAPPAPVSLAAPVAPQNTSPVPGGVARAATQEDVIRLRDMNLIGVYGRPNARRALVRLSNGRYVRVEVGSALDGGEVVAIGDEALNYVKRGRTYAIEMPGN